MTMRSIFGWSYPPGCSGPPEEPPIPKEAEEIWMLLEQESGISDQMTEMMDEHILAIPAEVYGESCNHEVLKEELAVARELLNVMVISDERRAKIEAIIAAIEEKAPTEEDERKRRDQERQAAEEEAR